jgi:hypothetical protein
VAICTVQAVLDDVRGLLSDVQVVGGETFTNNYLLGVTGSGNAGSGSLFGEPYRTMFSKITGGSKRVQPNVLVVLPANTTVLIPQTYNITDFSEPETIEERAAGPSIAIASTDTATPINVTCVVPHNLGPNGSMVEGAISGVLSTPAPWGNWFATVTGAETFSLNGSGSDGIAGTGGAFYPGSQVPFTEVFPADSPGTLDGAPGGCLGNYLWANNRLQFRGATSAVQLRITYYASGTAPTNPAYVIPIDNCRDFLATATASAAARAKGWMPMHDVLRNKAYGDPSHSEELSLIDLFYMAQVMADQRGPQRRQGPFRSRRSKFGTYVIG